MSLLILFILVIANGKPSDEQPEGATAHSLWSTCNSGSRISKAMEDLSGTIIILEKWITDMDLYLATVTHTPTSGFQVVRGEINKTKTQLVSTLEIRTLKMQRCFDQGGDMDIIPSGESSFRFRLPVNPLGSTTQTEERTEAAISVNYKETQIDDEVEEMGNRGDSIYSNLAGMTKSFTNRTEHLETENKRLNAVLAELNLKVHRIARKAEQSSNQVKALESENIKLKNKIHELGPELQSEFQNIPEKAIEQLAQLRAQDLKVSLREFIYR